MQWEKLIGHANSYGMEEIYKENLRKMRNESISDDFASALFENIGWECMDSSSAEVEQPVGALPIEKELVIESLQKFTTQKIDDEGTVVFDGGSISFKKPMPSNYKGEYKSSVKYLSFEQLLESASKVYTPEALEARYCENSDHPKSALSKGIKVLFVTDKMDHEAVQTDNLVRRGLSCFYDEEVYVLFEKMIGAMKLSIDDFLISKCSNEEEVECFNQEILYFRPQFVITLGASASNLVLQIKERLSNIHGQFFQRVFNKDDINEFHFKVCPLFNPEFLLINPTMKRTAWVDMQKVMKELGH